jgi:hypothetical protein
MGPACDGEAIGSALIWLAQVGRTNSRCRHLMVPAAIGNGDVYEVCAFLLSDGAISAPGI